MAHRVLIVDDSSTMRSIIKRVIVDLGFEVVQASGGSEGLARLADSGVDAVLVDWNMPQMSGIEFVKAVRGQSTHRQLPLVMVTTESSDEQRRIATEAGANGYVTKPFTPQQIQQQLEALGVRA